MKYGDPYTGGLKIVLKISSALDICLGWPSLCETVARTNVARCEYVLLRYNNRSNNNKTMLLGSNENSNNNKHALLLVVVVVVEVAVVVVVVVSVVSHH